MNKYFMQYASISLCALSIGTFCHNDRTRLGLHEKLPSSNDIFTPQQWTAAKVVFGMAGTAAVSYAGEKIIGKGDGKNFYNGTYAYGFSQALKISGACLSIAPMLNEEWGDQFFRFGTRAPIVSLAAIGISHPLTQQLALHAPLGLGQYISTYEKNTNDTIVSKCGSECQGVCTSCFIPKTLLVVGLYKVIDPLIDKVGTAVGKQLGFIHEDKKVE